MRMARGSGIAGLAAMARQSQRDGVVLARPLLHIPKARLVATLEKAKIGFADDPTNRDANFARPRLRAMMPALAAEGFDTRNLSRLASRLARANAALEILVDGAERYLALGQRDPMHGFDANAFAALAEEIRLRLLLRRIDRVGHEGPAELGKVEALLVALDRAVAATGPAKGRIRLKQTLAGALVSLVDGRIRIEPAPPRRRRTD
jgi:tRNA(Ile)-lysidine synthase